MNLKAAHLKRAGIAASLAVVSSALAAAELTLQNNIAPCLDPVLPLASRAEALGGSGLVPQTRLRPKNWHYGSGEASTVFVMGKKGHNLTGVKQSYLGRTDFGMIMLPFPVFEGEIWAGFSSPQMDVHVTVWESEEKTGCNLILQDNATVPEFHYPFISENVVDPIGVYWEFEPMIDGTKVGRTEPSDHFALWRPNRPDTHVKFSFVREKPPLLN